MIIVKNDENSVFRVVQAVEQGKIVILPTDTVYGFSGIVDLKCFPKKFHTDSLIRSIKGRSETKPLIQLIAKPEDIYDYTDDAIPRSLLDKWPCALTIIVNIKKECPLADVQTTVAFRCPGDEWLRTIIGLCNAPLYSTSVNRSGKPVLSRVADIRNEFELETGLIVDDGDKLHSVPSTIVSVQDGMMHVIRQGSIVV